MAKKDFLKNVLAPKVGATFRNKGGEHVLPSDHILLEVYDTHYEACRLDDFIALFGPALPDNLPPQASKAIYNALRNVDLEDKHGWKRHFDKWKAEGLIS